MINSFAIMIIRDLSWKFTIKPAKHKSYLYINFNIMDILYKKLDIE